MINEKSFSKEWMNSFKKQFLHSRIDTGILEKMIYALHLLEQLKINGLEFIFKGGTSLILLLQQGNRFSIDIDIICTTGREELEAILQKVVTTSRFTGFHLDEHRSYTPGVPKAHYIFEFESASAYSGSILLDILLDKPVYPQLIEKPIRAQWIETNGETLITVPSIDSITGDKLTAFAPNTIGIPYFKNSQPHAMEICKQLFDLGRLFEQVENMEEVAESFQAFAIQEIGYRAGESSVALTPEIVLKDIIATCITITKRGAGSDPVEKANFEELQSGIRAMSSFLMEGNFRLDEAIAASARVAHLAAKLLSGDFSPIARYTNQDIKALNIESTNWNFLNKLKKQPDKSSFYYWHQTVQLLEKSSF